ATGRLADVVGSCETIFIALPSLFIRPTLEPVRDALRADAAIVNLAKGIERATGLTSFQVISTLFPRNRKIMLAGPAIANEIAQGMPTVVTIAGRSTTDLLGIA